MYRSITVCILSHPYNFERLARLYTLNLSISISYVSMRRAIRQTETENWHAYANWCRQKLSGRGLSSNLWRFARHMPGNDALVDWATSLLCHTFHVMRFYHYIFSNGVSPHDWIDNCKSNIPTYHLIVRAKRGLCFDSCARHFVCGYVCVSDGYGHTPIPIIMQFRIYVLGTKVEWRMSNGFLISLPFSKWRLFCGFFSQLRALSEVYCSQK